MDERTIENFPNPEANKKYETELLSDNKLSFSEVRRQLIATLGLPDTTELLNLAQRQGRLSIELDFAVMETVRLAWQKFARKAEKGPIWAPASILLDQYDQEENANEPLLNEYSELVPEVKELILKQLTGTALTEEEKIKVKRIKTIREEIANIGRRSPMRLLAHFTYNGDLRFLWGMNEQNDIRKVGLQNSGGRTGTSSGGATTWGEMQELLLKYKE